MKNNAETEVRSLIDAAHAAAEAGQMQIAVETFVLARTTSKNLADPSSLKAAMDRDVGNCIKERGRYRDILSKKPNTTRSVLIMADSLGLPRADAKDGAMLGADRTYSGLIQKKYADLAVISMCQRFFTTTDAKQLLQQDPELGRGSDFLLHIGLNDCANRMFLEDERISLSLLTAETRDRMVDFSRKYRREIIFRQPPHHYVTLSEYRDNLRAIIELMRAREVGRIILTTIILPPAKFWPGTPYMNRNFANYNAEILNAGFEMGVDVMDFDRHVWQAQHRNVLQPDGMHLSDAGHQLFTDKCDPFLR